MKDGESRLNRLVSNIDEEDATSRYREERAGNNSANDSPGSVLSSDDERTLVTWLPNDPENPYNWSTVSFRRLCCLEGHELSFYLEKENLGHYHYHDDGP